MTDSEKLKDIILYTKSAEYYWRRFIDEDIDKRASIAKLMAVQDILGFMRMSLDIDVEKIWEEFEDGDNNN